LSGNESDRAFDVVLFPVLKYVSRSASYQVTIFPSFFLKIRIYLNSWKSRRGIDPPAGKRLQ
jgi:hypothetical protein